jgi:hypothetical protein
LHFGHICSFNLQTTDYFSFRCLTRLPNDVNLDAFSRVLLEQDHKTPQHIHCFRDTTDGREYFVTWENSPLKLSCWVPEAEVVSHLTNFHAIIDASRLEAEMMDIFARTCRNADLLRVCIDGLLNELDEEE